MAATFKLKRSYANQIAYLSKLNEEIDKYGPTDRDSFLKAFDEVLTKRYFANED